MVGMITFTIVHLIPGSPAANLLGLEATKAQVEQVERELGLDKPSYVQFYMWVSNLFRFNLGESIFLKQPVTKVIMSRLGASITIVTFSLIIAILMGVSTGIFAAFYQGKLFDNLGMTISIFGISIASFWLALNVMWLFSVHLRWLPVQGYVPISVNFLECIKHIILPGVCVAFSQEAAIARMTRSSMLDVLNQDYIRTAKAKGLSTKTILVKHALRNAILPVITIIGMKFAALIGGLVITEIIFNIPGLGSLFVMAVQKRDYPLVQGTMLFFGLLFVFTNLAVDLLYTFIDPRIRYDD